MIRLARFLKSSGLFFSWLLIAIFAFTACEGPRLTAPQIRGQVPTTPPDTSSWSASVVDKDGMEGVMQRALRAVKQLQQDHKDGKNAGLALSALHTLAKDVLVAHKANDHYFQKARVELSQKGMPAVALQRLQALEKEYRLKYQMLQTTLRPLLVKDASALNWEQVQRLQQTLETLQPPRRTPALNLQQLPFGRAQAGQRTPMSSPKEYAAKLGTPLLPTGSPINAPTAKDTAETEDITFTDGIKKLGAQLKTPLAMYTWVRNNIDFTPTYGSIQGADHCYQTRKCNAFDTASLLIALLRSQKIAARYVMGTIRVPIDKARNWVANFNKDNGPVGQALASAGIPAVSLLSGGKAQAIRMEHVWVEAWVDYVPSRGFRHKEGDTWIPMDPTFKPYKYEKGLDQAKTTGLDQAGAKALAEKFSKTGTRDALGGYTKAPDISLLQKEFKDGTTAYDKNRPAAAKSPRVIVGGRTILPFDLQSLPAALPYEVLTTGARVDTLPDKVRFTVTFKVTTRVSPPSPFGWSSSAGKPDFAHKISMPTLLSNHLWLAYNTASTADQQIVEKYYSGKTPPKSLPATINMKPVLIHGTKTLATGNSTRIGSDNHFSIEVVGPGYRRVVNNTIQAGSYQGVVLNPGSISPERLKDAQKQVQDLVKKMDQNQTPSKVSRELLFGMHLQAAGLGYWSQLDLNNTRMAQQFGVIATRLPSVGLFASDVNTTYSGFIVQTPRSVSFGRVSTDVDLDFHAVTSWKADKQDAIRFMKASGVYASSNEATIWEQVLRPKTANGARGISAIHMLQYAAQQGVPVYQITKANQAAILPKLSLGSETLRDIRAALAAGKTVTTAQRVLTKDGWKGVGYILMDEATGAAAYLISGGKAGGGNDLSGPAYDLIGLISAGANQSGKLSALMKGALNGLGAIISIITFFPTLLKLNDISHDLDLLKFFLGIAMIGWFVFSLFVGVGLISLALSPIMTFALMFAVSFLTNALIDYLIKKYPNKP